MEAKVSLRQLNEIETMMSQLPTVEVIADWKKVINAD